MVRLVDVMKNILESRLRTSSSRAKHLKSLKYMDIVKLSNGGPSFFETNKTPNIYVVYLYYCSLYISNEVYDYKINVLLKIRII